MSATNRLMLLAQSCGDPSATLNLNWENALVRSTCDGIGQSAPLTTDTEPSLRQCTRMHASCVGDAPH